MVIKRLAPLALLLVMLFVLVGVSSASPANVSLDRIYLHPAGTTATEIVARNLGPSGAGNGAIGFTVYIEYDHTKGTLTSVSTSAAFAALGCGFATFRTELGGSAAQIDGTCQSSIPTAGVAAPGTDIVMATLNWTCVAPFLVNIAAGPTGGTPLTEVFDPSFNEYFVPENQLTDGGACDNPTAVTLETLNAGPAIPTSNAIYPAIAGAVALLTAAGVAFRGVLRDRKSVV